jgi:hypothetical protein
MAFREVRVFEVREVLGLWIRGEGFLRELSMCRRPTVLIRQRPRAPAR